MTEKQIVEKIQALEWHMTVGTIQRTNRIPPDIIDEILALIDEGRKEEAIYPWNQPEFFGWSIVGMNHYHADIGNREKVRHLFCAMVALDGRCVKAESNYENKVFASLKQQIGALQTNPLSPSEQWLKDAKDAQAQYALTPVADSLIERAKKIMEEK